MRVKVGPIRNIEAIQEFVKQLPSGTVKVGLAAIVEYIIGDKQRGLKHDEPQKYISRKKAGYKTSAEQIRYFFAVGILENVGGRVVLNHYKRTGETSAAWKAVTSNNGYRITAVNDKPGAYWTRDNKHQTRQHALAGRRKTMDVIKANLAGALRHAGAKVKEYLKSK